MVRVTKLKLHRTISDIMKKGDLDSLTTKKIRLICEQKYRVDLSKRKSEIDKIVLAFVKKKSKEEDDDNEEGTNNQNNVNDEDSSESSCDEESGEEESGEDDESSCSGSESCSKSECSYSESSDDEPNTKVPANNVSAKNTALNIAVASKQPVAIASTSKQAIAVASTSKQTVVSAVPIKMSMRNVIAPPKKRLTLQSMNAAAADVAAIAAAAAAAADLPPKRPKIVDVNNKSNDAVVPSKKSSTANNSNDANNKTEMDDAAFARQLQAQEWNFRKRTVDKLFRNTPQKKIAKNKQTKKKKACPFLKKCLLSPALAEVLGTNEMSRPDVVQKMWQVVRERNLFDPSNKQFILCDVQLANLFGRKRIKLIGMMKYLKKHVKDVK